MYKIKFMFDYCASSCLWSDSAGVLPLEEFLISEELKKVLRDLCLEYDSILNWDNPASGFVWTLEQVEDFRSRAQQAYDQLIDELGELYEVRNLINKCLGIKN
ncbi:MAG: hypothetical protein E7283_05515 [Lachnospiraceae bacterium]|nr:hypothetical protein [Lachnospiraceae bacterium]